MCKLKMLSPDIDKKIKEILLQNNDFFGNMQAREVLYKAFLGGNVPHAWLFSGIKGIGKFSLALKFAECIFSNCLLFRKKLEAETFSDIKIINNSDKEITVDTVRSIKSFLNHTSVESNYKLVIIDNADKLNKNASNALLKLLEEPSQNNLLILISHCPSMILPTIKSRCRNLKLEPVDYSIINSVVENDKLARLASGSLGGAINFMESNFLDIYGKIVNYINTSNLKLVDELAALAKENSEWQQIEFIILHLLAKLAKHGYELPSGEVVDGERKALSRLYRSRKQQQWVQLYEQTKTMFFDATNSHLDKKHILILILENMKEPTS
jgi:DNA polymerase III subunit delta'